MLKLSRVAVDDVDSAGAARVAPAGDESGPAVGVDADCIALGVLLHGVPYEGEDHADRQQYPE